MSRLRIEETAAVFRQITAEGGLDLLVNSAWGGYEQMVEDGRFTWSVPAEFGILMWMGGGRRRFGLKLSSGKTTVFSPWVVR